MVNTWWIVIFFLLLIICIWGVNNGARNKLRNGRSDANGKMLVLTA